MTVAGKTWSGLGLQGLMGRVDVAGPPLGQPPLKRTEFRLKETEGALGAGLSGGKCWRAQCWQSDTEAEAPSWALRTWRAPPRTPVPWDALAWMQRSSKGRDGPGSPP